MQRREQLVALVITVWRKTYSTTLFFIFKITARFSLTFYVTSWFFQIWPICPVFVNATYDPLMMTVRQHTNVYVRQFHFYEFNQYCSYDPITSCRGWTTKYNLTILQRKDHIYKEICLFFFLLFCTNTSCEDNFHGGC